MKFLIDLALSPKTVIFLRGLGYDAIRVSEAGLSKAKDVEIMRYAMNNDMVVVTADLDFGEILAYTEYKKPSAIILRLKNPAPGHVNTILSSILPRIEESLKKGSIIIVEEGRIRIRELPLEKKK